MRCRIWVRWVWSLILMVSFRVAVRLLWFDMEMFLMLGFMFVMVDVMMVSMFFWLVVFMWILMGNLLLIFVFYFMFI